MGWGREVWGEEGGGGEGVVGQAASYFSGHGDTICYHTVHINKLLNTGRDAPCFLVTASFRSIKPISLVYIDIFTQRKCSSFLISTPSQKI